MAYVKPDELNLTEGQKQAFKVIPKYAFANAEDYSEISAQMSDVTVIAGGRNVAISDFMNAVKSGKGVIFLDNAALPEADKFEKDAAGAPKRPQNATSFLIEKIRAHMDGRPSTLDELPDMGMTKAFMDQYEEQLRKTVNEGVVRFDPANPVDIESAADRFAVKVKELSKSSDRTVEKKKKQSFDLLRGFKR